MDIPSGLKYSKDHEWVRVEANIGTIGITDYAQGELGDVVYVELPEVGRKIAMGETFGTIEAVKAVSELYSPVSGEITEVNDKLQDDPALVNKSPYADGWMVKVILSDPGDLAKLLSPDDYRKMVGA
jgi:glycine cleavage system H protein